jgi:hypothetical protein
MIVCKYVLVLIHIQMLTLTNNPTINYLNQNFLLLCYANLVSAGPF